MPIAQEPKLSPKEISARIRAKVADLNDELVLAALAEVDVEFVVTRNSDEFEPTHLRVWCSQEVR